MELTTNAAWNFCFMARPALVAVHDLVIAGWTGRDSATVEHHIAELQAIGVARPRTVPCFYRVGANLLTTEETIDVTGADGSGEVEFVLVSLPQGLYVGVGSDHTDRKVESYGVTVSKQMCPKPISRELWPFAEMKDHWDALVLRSWITRDHQKGLYQEGVVTRMLAPEDLIATLHGRRRLSPSAQRCSAARCRCWYRSGRRPNSRWNSKTRFLAARYAIGTARENCLTTTESR